jgi:hypothetical protein
MKIEEPDEQTLRKVLADIIDGFSITKFEEKKLFIKHFDHRDQAVLERKREEVYAFARSSGLPTERESLDLLIKEDIWTQEEETAVFENEKYLKNLQETKKNLALPSQIRKINKDIARAEGDLQDKQIKRKALVADTCESYSNNKNNDYSIYLCLYKDQELTKKFFTWDHFCAVSKATLNELFGLYVTTVDHLTVNNIKFLALNPMFSIYYNLMGNANIHNFFDKPIYTLTFYQLNLLNYGKVLNSIIENIEGIPDGVKQNPDDLLAYADSKSKHKKVADKSKEKQGFSIVGATKEDMQEMGVHDELSVSPFELAKEKGSLTIEDFQNFS